MRKTGECAGRRPLSCELVGRSNEDGHTVRGTQTDTAGFLWILYCSYGLWIGLIAGLKDRQHLLEQFGQSEGEQTLYMAYYAVFRSCVPLCFMGYHL